MSTPTYSLSIARQSVSAASMKPSPCSFAVDSWTMSERWQND